MTAVGVDGDVGSVRFDVPQKGERGVGVKGPVVVFEGRGQGVERRLLRLLRRRGLQLEYFRVERRQRERRHLHTENAGERLKGKPPPRLNPKAKEREKHGAR